MSKKIILLFFAVLLPIILFSWISTTSAANKGDYSLIPPFVSAGVPPLVMLVLGRNHKLYYEAYNDASDLDGDGKLDLGYKPDKIDYYGYFDSYKTYKYNTATSRFEPYAKTTDKKVHGPDEWSGDFLNYLTMSRMDTLRKVLYGGCRSTDTATETVLERVYIPQEGHSWGKEYTSVAYDGYKISDYTPFAQPLEGTRHLFASTTLSSDKTKPLLRVVEDNTHRIWDWVTSENAVCDNSNPTMTATGTGYAGHPANHEDFENRIFNFANASHSFGSGTISNIDGTGNPYGTDDHYLNLIEGTLTVISSGDYVFAVDGSDAMELLVDGLPVVGWYKDHGPCSCTDHKSESVHLTAGDHTIEFRHEEAGSGSGSYKLYWKGPDSHAAWEIIPSNSFKNLVQACYNMKIPKSDMTDYIVRVQVGVAGMEESNCRKYPNGTWKPVGLLQRNGESGRMMFGLISGSYSKNTSGGVLRKNIGSITDEIDSLTGQFKASVKGIIYTINQLKTVGFNGMYNSTDPPCKCGWYSGRLKDGYCSMWGNPLGEMMYEGLRYFAGKKAPTSAYDYGSGTSVDTNVLGLPRPTWDDPYDPTSGFDYCAKPFLLVISDINVSYDSDQLPGSYFKTFSGDVAGLDVETEADTITTTENISGNYYIGQSGSDDNFLPTPKNVTSLGKIRGLSPEETTKEGSYYSASIAYYGRVHDISAATGDQKIITYSVGLASPLPQIKIPVGDKFVTMVPFAKTVSSKIDPKPICGIVDFYVEELTPTKGVFRINFDDHEIGGDYDMDAVVKYTYEVAGSNVIVTLDSIYARTGNMQHMGYIISGTDHDGIYLDVRFADNIKTGSDDPDYKLDTPPGVWAQDPPVESDWKDGKPLPVYSRRVFTVGTSTAAKFLHNPLWYAAKWGGFDENEDTSNDKPDRRREWDADRDGVPDTYFYVNNPLKLEEQLNKSFADILRRTASGTAASVISSSRSGEGAVYQAIFYPEFKGDSGNTVNWVGDVNCFFIDAHGNIREDNNHNRILELDKDRIIKFENRNVFRYRDVNANGILDENEARHPIKIDITEVKPLWSAGKWLNLMNSSDTWVLTQRSYTGRGQRRFMFTFLDKDGNMVPSADTTIDNHGELQRFLYTNSDIYPYIHVIPKPFENTAPPDYLNTMINGSGTVIDASAYQAFANTQAKRVIKFIRGQDQGELTSGGVTIAAMRSRQVNYPTGPRDNTVDTWRLGDIVSSTPTIVGKPAEHYDLLYQDESYTDFRLLYRNRRQMVYAGGNDGVLHAFNGGFYDFTHSRFWKGYDSVTGKFNDIGLPLGAEMWAYVPWNLLPHLYWLTESDYDTGYHVAYVDLKPRIFDAKIFSSSDTTHKNGWGTIMVVGMRFGGGSIQADTNRDNTTTDGSGSTEPSFSSAYIIMDITDPEAEPHLLAELTMPDLGFTTCYPTVIPMKDQDSSKDNNLWYLVLGSGPAPAVGNSTADTLKEAISTQKGKIFLVDLKELAQNGIIKMVDSSGALKTGIQTFTELDNNSFISDPVTVDYDLDYKADAVYFGTVAGDFSSGWSGKLRRIVIENDDSLANWTGDSVLIDLGSVHNGQPIVGAPTITVDLDENRWVYFGTGRFFNRLDVTNALTAHDQQSFYGIKENRTWNTSKKKYDWLWTTVNAATDIEDVSGKVVTSSNTVFHDTITDVEGKKGWQLDFTSDTERNLGQAALLGDIVTFTTYKPSDDDCKVEGTSLLYALYYRSGTAYEESIFGSDPNTDEIFKEVTLGIGMTLTPNIHTGKDDGSKAFVQTSTGAIIGIKEANPGITKSGGVYWLERVGQ